MKWSQRLEPLVATAARPSQFKAVLAASCQVPFQSLTAAFHGCRLHGEALFTPGVPVLLARVLLFMKSLQVVFAPPEEG